MFVVSGWGKRSLSAPSHHKQCKLQLIFLSKQVMLGHNQDAGGVGVVVSKNQLVQKEQQKCLGSVGHRQKFTEKYSVSQNLLLYWVEYMKLPGGDL